MNIFNVFNILLKLEDTSVYSAEPIKPNSSAPQLPKMMDLRGLHLPATRLCMKDWSKNWEFYPSGWVLTLLHHTAQNPGYFQHNWRAAAGVDGSMDPTVPVVSIDHVSVCEGRAVARIKPAKNRPFTRSHRSHLAPRFLWWFPSHWRSFWQFHGCKCPVLHRCDKKVTHVSAGEGLFFTLFLADEVLLFKIYNV